MSYENIKNLYNDYNIDINFKKMIDEYYGADTNKFLRLLDYCLDNKCGLLLAIEFCLN